MPKRCILYPNDIKCLSYSPKYLYSGAGDVLIGRDTHTMEHLFALAVFERRELCSYALGFLQYIYDWRQGWSL